MLEMRGLGEAVKVELHVRIEYEFESVMLNKYTLGCVVGGFVKAGTVTNAVKEEVDAVLNSDVMINLLVLTYICADEMDTPLREADVMLIRDVSAAVVVAG